MNADIIAPKLGDAIIVTLSQPEVLKQMVNGIPEIMERDIWFLFTGEFWLEANQLSWHDNMEIKDRRKLFFDSSWLILLSGV